MSCSRRESYLERVSQRKNECHTGRKRTKESEIGSERAKITKANKLITVKCVMCKTCDHEINEQTTIKKKYTPPQQAATTSRSKYIVKRATATAAAVTTTEQKKTTTTKIIYVQIKFSQLAIKR